MTNNSEYCYKLLDGLLIIQFDSLQSVVVKIKSLELQGQQIWKAQKLEAFVCIALLIALFTEILQRERKKK